MKSKRKKAGNCIEKNHFCSLFCDDAQFRKFLRSTETHFAKLSLTKMQTDGYRSIIAINCELSNENPAKPIEILERN